jgi:hypothetical protein
MEEASYNKHADSKHRFKITGGSYFIPEEEYDAFLNLPQRRCE